MIAPPKISVVIVTYNSAPVLEPTLEAALAQDYPDYEVILVDNASADDSLAVARRFEGRGLCVIANETNRGFAGGNNDGVAASRGELILLLNPDAILPSDGLSQVAGAFAQRPGMGILGAKLVAEDGRTILHCGGRIGIPAHCELYGRGEQDEGQWDRPAEVDFVVGALMGLRRETWDRLGGFDEDFNPAYFEDTDLCVRCRRLGLKVVYWPLRVIHRENVSCEYRSPEFYYLHHKNRLWFTFKNMPLWELFLIGVPSEIFWYFSKNGRGFRDLMPGLYRQIGRRFIRKRLLGRS